VMDKLVSQINNLSGNEPKQLDQLQTLLTKEVDVIVKHRGNIESALGSFLLPKNTLGYLHFLSVWCGRTVSREKDLKDKDFKYNKKNFVRCVISLIKDAALVQIRYDPKKFGLVCIEMVQALKELNEPIRAVQPLRLAIAKLEAKDHLTPQHAQLTLACILSKTYKTALPYLDDFVFQIDPTLTGVREEDTRLYFYYGAVCYIAMKKWKKATQFLETVISAPALVPSAVMVDSYKKYILVNLIMRGNVPDLPRVTSQSVLRISKQVGQPYDELATAYGTGSNEDLVKCVENNTEVYLKDSNMGLVGQVVSALHDQNIRKLTKTYLTLTFESIASHLQIKEEEAQQRIIRLISTGELAATIHQNSSYVEFKETDAQYVSPQMVHFLEAQIKETLTINRNVVDLDRNIESSEKYARKLLGGERRFEGDF